MPSALRYITKDSHPDIQEISKQQKLTIRGRRYDPKYAAGISKSNINEGGNIQITEIIKGIQYAFVSISDDKPGTLHKVGSVNPWYLRVMKMMLLEKGNVNSDSNNNNNNIDKSVIYQPLSEILKLEPFQLHTVDHIMDISRYTSAGHALDTQGYIAHNDTTIVLAYRCTTSAKDWITNLSMTTSAWEINEDVAQGHSGYFSSCADYACCVIDTETDTDHDDGVLKTKNGVKPRVHTGFYNNFLVTVPLIQKYIDPLLFGENEPPRTLYVTGHSLGAGIAMMAACYFIMEPQYQSMWRNVNNHNQLRVVTVGGPRACCQSMQEQVDATIRELRPTNKVQVLQLVRDKDCVPTVPPEIFGFRHLQEKVVYITKEDKDTNRGQVIINPDTHQVIRKKKFHQLLKEKPEVFAPHIVTPPVSTSSITIDSNDDDDVESVSDMEDMNRGTEGMDGEDIDRTNFDDNTLSEQEWIEKYNKKIKMIPRAFRDHMPDFYYDPLLKQLQDEVKVLNELNNPSSSSKAVLTKQQQMGDDTGNMTNTSESDMDDDVVPYESINSESHESSVYEVITKKKRFNLFGRRNKQAIK